MSYNMHLLVSAVKCSEVVGSCPHMYSKLLRCTKHIALGSLPVAEKLQTATN